MCVIFSAHKIMRLVTGAGGVKFIGHKGYTLAVMMNKYLSLLFLLATLPVFVTHADDSLEHIKQAHKINLSYSYNDYPFSFVEHEKPVGLAVDLCHNIVSKIKKQLNIPHLDINWVGEKQSVTFIKVKEQAIDMTCSAITITAIRSKSYHFSNPFFITTTALLSQKSDVVHQSQELRGKTIGVISGSSAIEHLNKLNRKLGFSLLMVTQTDYASALENFRTGEVKMLANDGVLLAAFKANDPENLAISQVDFGDMDSYGLMMAKGADGLTAAVNTALDEIIASGEYDQLYKKWFLSPIPPMQKNLNMPMSKALLRYIKSPHRLNPHIVSEHHGSLAGS
ncbi:hypothetical protein EHN07_03165 [Buttiauxella warmboldiae]|uniref:Solute-binding protein family 3/N-terminal domain-containing protein n=1 Tax=Buttiauxella warmboldiae TaxID=82993 RepID=A0A3N5DRF9_9ENTR|nr:transporter substrate-binding domain-containing protein [Buttiauxella warmboldiae]RPH30127.1 hypothetical protein EHN07_03165 [Buttiauxella warmboldiae]